MKIRSLVVVSVLVVVGVVMGIRAHGNGGAFGASFGGAFLGTSVANVTTRNNGGGCDCNSMQNQINNLQSQLNACLKSK